MAQASSCEIVVTLFDRFQHIGSAPVELDHEPFCGAFCGLDDAGEIHDTITGGNLHFILDRRTILDV